MKTNKAYFAAALALLSSSAFMVTQARMHHLFFDDGFMFDDVFEEMREHMQEIRQQMASFGPSKEERAAVKKAHETLKGMEPSISEDDQHVIITFPIPDVDKKAIDISVEDDILTGTIPTQNAKVQFSMDANYLRVARTIELKQEDKANKTQKTAYYGSLSTIIERLPYAVDVNTAKAETKDNVLTLTIAKKQQTKVAIAHS